MGVHKRKFNHQFYSDVDKTLPRGVGDRYYAQDLARDHRYLQGLAGRAVLALMGRSGATLLQGGAVTEGTTKARVNVSAALALVWHGFTVPDDDQEWLVPPPTGAAEAPVLVEYPGALDLDLAALGATLDGVTVNYLKLRYREAPVQSRNRQYAAGSYDYSLEDSHELACDAAAPTDADAVLAEITGNGFTILNITRSSALGASPAIIPGSVMSRDASGRTKAAAPAAADDVARKNEVDAAASAASSALTAHANLTNPHSATSLATASRLVLRDASGRAAFADPAAADDAVTKGFDSMTAALEAALAAVLITGRFTLYNTSGTKTWTKVAGSTWAILVICGGGGAGQSTTGTTRGGGGGGGACGVYFFDVRSEASLTFAVGAAAAASTVYGQTLGAGATGVAGGGAGGTISGTLTKGIRIVGKSGAAGGAAGADNGGGGGTPLTAGLNTGPGASHSIEAIAGSIMSNPALLSTITCQGGTGGSSSGTPGTAGSLGGGGGGGYGAGGGAGGTGAAILIHGGNL